MTTSNRERQEAELLLLESMYPDSFRWSTKNGQAPSKEDLEASDPKISLELQAGYTLEITLPAEYPETAKPSAYLNCSGEVSTTSRKAARQALADSLANIEAGIECLDILIQDLMDRLNDLRSTSAEEEHASQSSVRASSGDSTKIKTVLLWSHHLLATSKRKDIVAWSRELSLAGYSRPGYPGAILIEGEEDDADEFVSRIKALRWQALQIRGEDLASKRRIRTSGSDQTLAVKEVEGLNDIVEELREIDGDLASWFLEGMKIGHH